MTTELFHHHYRSDLVGWLELCTSGIGVRSISFCEAPEAPVVCSYISIMDRLIAELDDYFRGKPTNFSVALDIASGTDFQRRVWKQLTTIPYGETRSYGQVAAALGKPSAGRAVGSANRSNPIAIVIPCHRVVQADGGLGGYASGVHIKEKLLRLEGAGL